MSLDIQVSKVLKKDANGWSTGVLKKIVLEEKSDKKNTVSDLDSSYYGDDAGPKDISYHVYMFYFEGDCLAGEKMEMKIMTSRKINPTKIAVKGAGRGKNELKQYNKLTQMCLRLGFLSENELKNLNDVTLKKVDDQLKNTTNLHVKFKPVPSKKDPNLEAIGLATLQSVALAQEKNTKTQ